MLLINFPDYELFGIDGALILASVAVAALGIGIAIWLFGIFNSKARLADGGEPHRTQPRQPVPVHRLPEQVVLRRSSTICCSTASAAASPTA